MKRTLMICVILLIALSAGCANADKSSPEVQDNTYLSDLSPEEILETAFDALKKPDGKTFNACVEYPDEEHDNVYFGNDLSDDDGYIEALFEEMSYEVLQVKEQKENSTIISCKISNKDLNNLDYDTYSDEGNPMVSAIKHADTNIVSNTVDINMERKDEQWKIIIDDNFTKAISGGHW